MKKFFWAILTALLFTGMGHAADRGMNLSFDPNPAVVGQNVHFTCQATGEWRNNRITKAELTVRNESGVRILNRVLMAISDKTATYDYKIASDAKPGKYNFECRVSDGEESETRKLNFNVTGSQNEEYTVLTVDDFENGWGNFTDGGGDCTLYTAGAYAHQGNSAANVQDNSGMASSFYLTNGIDVATPGYSEIKVEFYFYAVGMDLSENFWVQYFDGVDWRTVANYAQGSDFNNKQFYFKTVAISKSQYAFPSNMKIRFLCDASGDADDIYIDEVKISVIGGSTPSQNRPPVANPGGPYTGIPGQSVSFNGSGSSDPDGNPLTYSWNFGDNSTGTGATPAHTYAAAGTFTVTLTVNDGKGGSNAAQTTATISAANRPPVANPGGPYTGTVGQSVSFNGSGSSDPDGNPLTYSWNFGDNSTGTGATPAHTYAAAGTFTVTLTVNDGKGGSNAAQTTATISAANRSPIANPGGPYTGTVGQSVSFNGSGSSDPDGNPLTYSWNFGDNSTGTGATPAHTYAAAGTFTVTLTVNDGKGGSNAAQTTATINIAAGGHASIQSYEGPVTCVACHQAEAQAMLNSLHVKWAGPTPELTNTNGEELGKAKGGINTFCTYAMSSKAACFTCHIRTDGNAPDAPQANDVDCLMCHNDVYQRKFTPDPDNSRTVTNILGQIKTYVFGKTDTNGNYQTEPDFAKMPAGTTMASLAQSVHLPTKKSCLRCHGGAGGGDWTKRGDIGVNSADPTIDQDFHMSAAGANLSCADCHSKGNHLIGGRGIDLRETEAPDPKCTDCHSTSPHADATVNRHTTGRVACQVCHIQTFGKGGATEISRDWFKPYWNPGLCQGQGGFPGEEFKLSNVKPDYRWFDGTSYVYNVGETISPNPDGTYTMAKANGTIFDGKSNIVPIKDHWSVMALSTDGRIVPPIIMDMFMTGYFDQAIQAGMDEQGMPGTYQVVNTNAEMLITHGVDPKANAPTCTSCHASNGKSNLMLPFAELGYHKFLANVETCTRCHGQKTASFTSMHDRHVRDKRLSCTQCHTTN